MTLIVPPALMLTVFIFLFFIGALMSKAESLPFARPTLSVLSEIGRFALPICVAQFASIGIFTADLWMMGQLSTFDLAAGSLAVRLYQPFYFCHLGCNNFCIGCPVLGADHPRCPSHFRQGYFIAGLGLCFMIPVLGGETLCCFRAVERDRRPCTRFSVLVSLWPARLFNLSVHAVFYFGTWRD